MAILVCLAGTLPAAQSGDFRYTDDGAGITIVDYPTTAVGALNIPATINGKPVTRIGESAFRYCSGLTSVTLPDSVASIGGSAFLYCYGLTSVTIGNGVTSIAYVHACTASGPPAPTFSVTSGALPDGLALDPDGRISGTPAVRGLFTGTITAANGFLPDATQEFSIDTRTHFLTTGGSKGSVAGGGLYLLNSIASLAATPNPGYVFTGWAGDASSTGNPVLVLMDSDKAVTGHFAPDLSDPDGDGLTNFDELVTCLTNPHSADSDGDGTPDADEDLDGDGLTNIEELGTYHTMPGVVDTDGDGISDFAELGRAINKSGGLDGDRDRDHRNRRNGVPPLPDRDDPQPVVPRSTRDGAPIGGPPRCVASPPRVCGVAPSCTSDGSSTRATCASRPGRGGGAGPASRRGRVSRRGAGGGFSPRGSHTAARAPARGCGRASVIPGRPRPSPSGDGGGGRSCWFC